MPTPTEHLISGASAADRALLERLARAGATAPGAASALADLAPDEAERLRRLLAAGIVREAAPGAYFLDEGALRDRVARRRPLVTALVALLLGALIVAGALLIASTR
ncbi:MAG TPA: hypothetical protein VFS05_07845 [Gemmatimonadaceae bacterium]|nr:hypothetical protein [Gemmatimonadaceae bacterium]